MKEKLFEIAGLFDLQGKVVDVAPLGEGFINIEISFKLEVSPGQKVRLLTTSFSARTM